MRLLVALALLAPAVTDAAVLCVDRAGGGCHSTIAAAVHAAAPADTIHIAAGVYLENVVIPAGKDGLRLVGRGRRTVVDPDVPNAGAGIRIESNGVEVTALQVRNGQQAGVAVGGGAQRAFIHHVELLGGRGPAAIRAEAGSTQLRIVANEVRSSGLIGIELVGGNDASVIRANRVTQMESGIVVRGNDLEVAANDVSIFQVHGIRVEGARAQIVDNRLDASVLLSTPGLAVVGTNPVVRRNRLTNAGTLDVSCTSCSGGIVARNTSFGAIGLSFEAVTGIHVTADAPGLVVQRNEVSRAVGPAFSFEGTGIHATLNVARDSGTPDSGDGFRVRGAHVLSQNTAIRCSRSGFQVEGAGAILDDNVSQEAGLNGFLIINARGETTGNTLTSNRALSSNAAGFAVIESAAATTLSGNHGSDNRYDFCDEGSGTLASGNAFATTSSVCDVRR
jgi:hypothetical protein